MDASQGAKSGRNRAWGRRFAQAREKVSTYVSNSSGYQYVQGFAIGHRYGAQLLECNPRGISSLGVVQLLAEKLLSRVLRFSRGTGAEMDQAIGKASGRKSRTSALTLLMFFFAIFSGLVVTLILLQDRMIDAQRDLIHGLFQVQHRTLVRAQNTRNPRLPEKAPAKISGLTGNSAPATSDSSSVSSPQISLDQSQPSTQVPLSHNASSETPSSQAKPQASSKSGRNSRKAAKPSPAPPPAAVTDPSDQRRVLNSI